MYQIDQSGKIEQTNRLTVVAVANGKTFSIRINAKDKKILKKIFREWDKPNIFSIQVFAILIYVLLEKAQLNGIDVVIDKEYLGHEDLIKSYIIQLMHKFQKVGLSKENIEFGFVGKSSSAHYAAHSAFRSH